MKSRLKTNLFNLIRQRLIYCFSRNSEIFRLKSAEYFCKCFWPYNVSNRSHGNRNTRRRRRHSHADTQTYRLLSAYPYMKHRRVVPQNRKVSRGKSSARRHERLPMTTTTTNLAENNNKPERQTMLSIQRNNR